MEPNLGDLSMTRMKHGLSEGPNRLMLKNQWMSCGKGVPPKGSSTEGESGPKIRLKGIVDGQQGSCSTDKNYSRDNSRSFHKSSHRREGLTLDVGSFPPGAVVCLQGLSIPQRIQSRVRDRRDRSFQPGIKALRGHFPSTRDWKNSPLVPVIMPANAAG
ncbi:hypothetical protein HAX54_034849 [Datura stramonium]|uniref:Uncharacterized protein n=1 Tax=Datura stramonium TaxID=4076 RepID=A0ABS8VHG9_DATST|nr:hypothetical protein [Datura stramonium]